MRLLNEDKQAHHCNVLRIPKSFYGRCRSNWRKGKAFTRGDLADHGLIGEKSAEAIVADGNEPPSTRGRTHIRTEGLNIRLSQIRQGGLNFEFSSLVLNKDKGNIGVKSDDADT
jgi:hypothetical protein